MKTLEVLKRFLNDERGLETIEYAIIAGLITVGIITTVISIGQWVEFRFSVLDNNLALGGAS